MQRRRFLAALGTTGVASTAGCASVLGGSSNTHLSKPEGQSVRSANLPYPAFGQELPEVTVPDPVAGTEVTTTQYDDRNVLITFFYTHCNSICPFLISSLRQVHTAAKQNDYADDMAVLAITFDPKRDTADRLREYADMMHVDVDADNWHFLRPESEQRAKSVVQETFGVTFQKTGATGSSMYMFNHLGLIVLANQRGYVERAYTGDDPKAERVRTDLETVVDAQS
jgi:protein SCO1/2